MPTDAAEERAARRGRTDLLRLVAVGAVVAGAALRFVAPSHLWLDEALSVNIASLPPGDLLDALARDGHPPVYYLLLHAWMALVGESDAAVRALSGVISLASLPLAYLVGVRRGGRTVGLAALAVAAMSPFALRYGSETRMYALVMFLVLAAWLLVEDRRAERPGRWRGPLLALVVAALVLTHYWGLFLVGAALALLVLAALGRRRRGEAWRGDAATAGWVAAGAACFAVWVPTFVDQLASTGTPWAPPVRPSSAVGLTLVDLGGGGLPESVLGAALLAVLLVLAATGRPTAPTGGDGDRRARPTLELDLRTVPGVRDVLVLAALTLVGGATVGWLGGSTFATRYAAVVAPLVLVAVAYGAVRVADVRWQAALVGAVCLLGLVGTARELTFERTQLGEVAEAVAARAQPGDVVLYCPDQLGPAGERVLPDGLDQVVYPTLAGPRFVDWVDYADRMAASDPVAVAAAVHRRAGADRAVFVVSNPGYRTVEERCDLVRDALAVHRGPGERLVTRDGERYWESAGLTWFPAG